jgi:hypothetical protein
MNEKIHKEIEQILSSSKLPLTDILEILANLLISEGLKYIDTSDGEFNKLEIASSILKDIERNGQTLPNSTVRQGLILLTWLKSKEKNE